jgi:hypothetical protein
VAQGPRCRRAAATTTTVAAVPVTAEAAAGDAVDHQGRRLAGAHREGRDSTRALARQPGHGLVKAGQPGHGPVAAGHRDGRRAPVAAHRDLSGHRGPTAGHPAPTTNHRRVRWGSRWTTHPKTHLHRSRTETASTPRSRSAPKKTGRIRFRPNYYFRRRYCRRRYPHRRHHEGATAQIQRRWPATGSRWRIPRRAR